MSDKQENSRQTPNDAATLRKQAEEQARSMEPIALSTQTPEGIQRMLHELRVHQIELEMQNEELRTAQAQIEAERARYFDFYNLATVGYCTLSEQELILDANLTTATLLATTRSELVTQPLSRFIHSDDQDIYYLLRKKLFETGEAQECDLRLVKPDGTLFWVHLTGTTTQGEDGASVCYMVLSDITERKRVEEALIHSRALFRGMFKDHSVVMLLIDPNSGQIVKANQAAAQYYGYPLENLIQMKIQQLNVLSAAEIAAKMSSAFNRQVNIFEFRHVLADGQVRDVQVHSTPITIQNQILLFSIIQDITDRKRVEESVRESEERFRSAFEHSAIGMALVSPEGKWLRVNNRVADIVGYTADELMCKTFQEITHPEDLKTDLDFVRQMLAGEIETYEMEKRYLHKDGHIVWGLLAVSLVRDKNGAPLHFISQIQDTTERKRVIEALKKSEFRARAMLQAIPDMMFRMNSHGVFLNYKADISDLYAPDIPTIIGQHTRDILPSEFVDLLDEKIRTALETGSLQTFEYQLPNPGRGLRDYEGRMIRSAADEVTTIVRDITERKRVEEALRKSEELLTASQSLSKVGGWEWNVETQTIYWTEETYRIHDFTPGEMEPGSKEYLNRSVECYEPEVRPVILAAFQRCVEEGHPYDLELPFTTAKGRRLWIRTTARPVRESGKVIRVIGNIIDITELKRAEEALLAERKRLEFVIDGSSLGTWAWNVQTNETIFNEAWAAMLGYTLEELTPTSVQTWIALMHPEDLKKAESLLALCLTGEKRDYTCELRMKHKDGHWLWILDRGRIMTWDDTGKPLSMFGTHDDITDRKHHEQQLAAALSEKEVLLREVHHRVKNNLAAMISLMDMQRRNLEDPNGQIILAELSNRIRSMSLVHEKLYRADSLATIDFHDYIQALTSHLRTTFGSPDIICQIDAHGITIPLDLASPCGLIVNELITNALKYAFPDGKPRPGNTHCQILVRLKRDQDTYTLTVADNGIGWPAGFDWKKTKTLGLTLVRMLGQHQLGGHYVVDQENGTSLTLTFTDRKKEVPVHG